MREEVRGCERRRWCEEEVRGGERR